MSEIIDNLRKKKEVLKHMILQLHKGEAPEEVRPQLVRLMGQVPYGTVVEVEQELIQEGLPTEEVLALCDVHGEALRGLIDLSASKTPPPGHPVHTFLQENRALEEEIAAARSIIAEIASLPSQADCTDIVRRLRDKFDTLSQVDTHYRRKENLVFPYLEKHGITGPPKVMWGKDDEIRDWLKAARQALGDLNSISAEDLQGVAELLLSPALTPLEDMIYKEEQILFPMCLDTLTAVEWYEVYRQSPEIGFCLYEPSDTWQPEPGLISLEPPSVEEESRIELPSGSLSLEELIALFNALPFDLTFVDRHDTVRFFTEGRDRIFDRNRAIIGRKVQMCHPPASVHVVQQILDDFHSGREDRAAFWINYRGRFVHIEYLALRNHEGEYVGTLEVTQDLTEKRKLQGEQRLLNYSKRNVEQ